MDWIELVSIGQLEDIQKDSVNDPEKAIVIFKHSTRCLTSKMAKNMFSGEYSGVAPVYLLNVVENREISNKIEDLYQVGHESPQVLIIKNGKSVFNDSHSGINAEEIMKLTSEPS